MRVVKALCLPPRILFANLCRLGYEADFACTVRAGGAAFGSHRSSLRCCFQLQTQSKPRTVNPGKHDSAREGVSLEISREDVPLAG